MATNSDTPPGLGDVKAHVYSQGGREHEWQPFKHTRLYTNAFVIEGNKVCPCALLSERSNQSFTGASHRPSYYSVSRNVVLVLVCKFSEVASTFHRVFASFSKDLGMQALLTRMCTCGSASS